MYSTANLRAGFWGRYPPNVGCQPRMQQGERQEHTFFGTRLMIAARCLLGCYRQATYSQLEPRE